MLKGSRYFDVCPVINKEGCEIENLRQMHGTLFCLIKCRHVGGLVVLVSPGEESVYLLQVP